MPERPRGNGSGLRRALREWPLVGAALALGSLAFLPRWFPGDVQDEEAAYRRLVQRTVAPADFDLHARAFLERWPQGPAAGEVHLLAGRALVERFRAGDPAADPRLASEHAAAARRLGRPGARSLQRDIARALLDRGPADAAVAAFRGILDSGDDPDAAVDLARALAAQAAADPVRADTLLAEALERAPSALLQAELCRRAGKPARALKILEGASFEPGAGRGALFLERARTLAQLDRYAEALAALDLAVEQLSGPLHADRLGLARVELLSRARSPEAEGVALAMERDHLPSAPVARLLAAAGRGAAGDVASALSGFSSAAALATAGVDLDWIQAALRAAAGRPLPALEDIEAALLQLARLRPADPSPLLDAARTALLRARRAADPASARRDAGERFRRAVDTGRLPPEEADRALLDGAAAFEAADRPERAAALYRRAYEASPRRNAECLLQCAAALRRAGLLLRGADGRPGALEAYTDYADRAAAGDPGVPVALLGRACSLEELGRHEEALDDFDRVRADGLGLAPASADWEASLLGRGRVLLALGRPLEAAVSLEEYLERYGAGGEARGGAVEAAVFLSRARTALASLEGALEALETALALPAKDERSRVLQRDARFLRGELLLGLGRVEEAERAFAEGVRARAGDPERLWGLAGRSRALVRLGRLDEARRVAEAGRRLYEDQRERYDASYAGRARGWWESVAEDLK